MSYLDLFIGEFVPNIQGAPYHSKWVAANKNSDAPKWAAYRDALKASQSPPPPAMSTKYGRALVAAGKMAGAITALTVFPGSSEFPSETRP